MMTRRSLLAVAGGAPLLRAQTRPLQFGFSLYGMKTLPWREGLGHVARIGYKATELSLRPGWNTEAKLLTKSDRAEIRKRISDLGLALPSVMENLGLGPSRRQRPGQSRTSQSSRGGLLRMLAEATGIDRNDRRRTSEYLGGHQKRNGR